MMENKTREYLIMKLQGNLQSWGKHTFEGFRPSELFPTRSGIIGLLGACLGYWRNELDRLAALDRSIGLAVRIDFSPVKLTDYHTIKNARECYTGLKSHDTIQSWREYLADGSYTVGLWNLLDTKVSLEEIEIALKKPFFTPFLGRRSCPICRPLFERRIKADSVLDVFNHVLPYGGTIYSEEDSGNCGYLQLRDVPIAGQPRQFTTRKVYMINGHTGGAHVYK